MHLLHSTVIVGLLALGANAAPTEVDPVLFRYTLSFTDTCSKNNFQNPLEFRKSQLPLNDCLVWSDFLGTKQAVTSFTVLDTISNGVCTSKLTTLLLFGINVNKVCRSDGLLANIWNYYLSCQLPEHELLGDWHRDHKPALS